MRDASCEILVGRTRIEHAAALVGDGDGDGDASRLCAIRRYFRSPR
jgi:hypothetical protein